MMTKAFDFSRDDEIPVGNPLPMQIADWIAERIFSGQLVAGDRLKEEELARLFNTSRAPVREALYLLQLDGLVERLPRRGTVIRTYSDEDIRDLYEARVALELTTIDRLRTRLTEEVKQDLQDILAAMREAVLTQDSRVYSECNTRFHDTLFHYAGSKILHRLYQQLGHPLKFLLEFSTQSTLQMQASYDEHLAIVETLCSHNFTKAKEILQQNVHHGMSRVISSRNHVPPSTD